MTLPDQIAALNAIVEDCISELMRVQDLVNSTEERNIKLFLDKIQQRQREIE